MKKNIKSVFTYTLAQFKDPYYRGFASSLSFYIILSIVPMLILLSQLLGVFGLSLESMGDLLSGYLSDEMSEIIKSLMFFSGSTGSNLFFILLVIWSASKAQYSLVKMSTVTMFSGEEEYTGFFKERVWALVSVVIIMIAFTIGLVILVYGGLIFSFVIKVLDTLLLIPQDVLSGTLWLVLRWPVSFFVYFVLLLLNYYLMARRQFSIKIFLPGAAFASVGILLVTFFYSLYINYISNYDILYGALASIVALMMWVFLISWCLGVGLIINRAFLETKGS